MLTKVTYILRSIITQFQDSTFSDASVAPTKTVCIYTIILLLTIGNYKVQCLGGIQWQCSYQM